MTAVEWLDAMSPWPRGGFGLDRMRALLAALGDPQDAYPAIHVVGTNGKSTATVTIEQLLLSEGLSVGSTISPHVVGWSERIRVNGQRGGLRVARSAVSARPPRQLGSTQFEIVTAAALAAFADAAVDVAVVEAGLGGRHDATNVLRTRVVLLTNVGLEHTDVLGNTLEAIATEKLAVARRMRPSSSRTRRTPTSCLDNEVVLGGAREAAEAFVGHAIDAARRRLARRAASSAGAGEVRDGAHNPDGARHLVISSTATTTPIVASILADKDVDAMLSTLRRAGRRFVATSSSSLAPFRQPSSQTSRGRASSTWRSSTTPWRPSPVRTSSASRCS